MCKTTERPLFHKGDLVGVRKETGPNAKKWLNMCKILEECEYCKSYHMKNLE